MNWRDTNFLLPGDIVKPSGAYAGSINPTDIGVVETAVTKEAGVTFVDVRFKGREFTVKFWTGNLHRANGLEVLFWTMDH